MTSRDSISNADPRWRLLDSIARRLLYLATRIGIAPAELGQRIAALAANSIGETPIERVEPRTFEESHSGPEIMHVWFRDLDFVDANGQPRRLPLRGAFPSFEHLVKRSAPRVSADVALQELRTARAVEVTGDGLVIPLTVSVVVSGETRRAEKGLYAVDNLLQCVETNVQLAPTLGSFQREAVLFRFDRRHLPRVHRYLSQVCASGLEQADDWLHQNAMEPGAVAETATVVVGTYIRVSAPNDH
jgi:hypothetical protein